MRGCPSVSDRGAGTAAGRAVTDTQPETADIVIPSSSIAAVLRVAVLVPSIRTTLLVARALDGRTDWIGPDG
ncbi:hypothetical protein HY68_30165 [Streptomyces sp. AcH 505]|nr:hypothetical protein HY68_30165 [Streptomyces sp. AcH 505]